jgi:hypothetical protein
VDFEEKICRLKKRFTARSKKSKKSKTRREFCGFSVYEGRPFQNIDFRTAILDLMGKPGFRSIFPRAAF